MIIEEDEDFKKEKHDISDLCRCDELSKFYKNATQSVFPARRYHDTDIKLEPFEVKLEPLSCHNCSTSLYTHNTDEIQVVGGEHSVSPLSWLSPKPSFSALLDHLKRSVKVCHLPSDVHQESLKGVMSMAGPVITLDYFYQAGQHMQYWLCEYQSERDVLVACKKLNGFPCHGTNLKVIPALKNRADLDVAEDQLQTSAQTIRSTRCRICDKKYSTSVDLKVHLLLSHRVYPNIKPSNTALMKGKVSKERPCSRTIETKKVDTPFNVKEWVECRPHRNPDYVEPHNYVLDAVIGVQEDNEKLGFIPIDHMYANINSVVRGSVPNSVLNGPDAITFHPSMVCLMNQNSKLKYVPVEHSYCSLEPQQLWCSVCGHQYNSLELLNSHLPVHFKKKGEKLQDESVQVSRKRRLKRAPKDEMFTCKMCSSEFNCKSMFITHVTAHENDDEMEVVTHKCQHCDLCFPSDVKMIKHQLLHECETCNETFKCLNEAQNHRDSHILLDKAKCCCEICGKKFLNVAEFLEHLLDTNHPITKQSRRILSIPRHAEHYSEFTLEARQGDFHCLKCSKTCESDIELYSHMGFHFVYKAVPPPYVLPPETEEISQTSDESPTKEYEPVKVRIPLSSILNDTSPLKELDKPGEDDDIAPGAKICHRCIKKFRTYRALKTHFRFCKKKPLSAKNITSNEKEATVTKEAVKSPPLNFKCIKCDIGFISEFLLKSHINLIHKNEETFRVKVGKARKSAVKLYKCSDCDKTFAKEIGLKAHHAAAHSDFSGSKASGLKKVLEESSSGLKKVLEESSSGLKKVLEDPSSGLKKVLEDSLISTKNIYQVQAAANEKEVQADESFSNISPSPMKRRGIMKSPPSHETGVIRARKTAAKLFKCKACDIRFGSKRILAFHMQQHADGKINDGRTGKDVSSKPLDEVLVNHDPPEETKELRKPVLNSPVREGKDCIDDVPHSVPKSRKVAKKTIIKKIFECDICEELFTNRLQYISHIKSHTNDPTETSSLSDGEADKVDQAEESRVSSFSTPSETTEMEVSVPLPQLTDSTDFIPADAIFYVDDDKLDGLMDETSPQSLNAILNETEASYGNRSANGDPSVEEVKTCNMCKKQFLAWSTICAHMASHPNSTFKDVTVDWKSKFNPLFECVICQEKVHSVAHCYLHYKYHVLEHSSTAVISHLDIAANGDNSQIIKCSVCGNTFDKIGTLHTHMKMHVPRVGFDDPSQVPSDPSHEKCGVCHRIVTPKSKRRHFEIHDQPLKHICELCYEEFPDQKGYIIHYYQMHKSNFEKDLKLTASANSNGRNQMLSNSLQPSSDFQCLYCRSTFLSLKSKRNHEYKHKKHIFKVPCTYSHCYLNFQTSEELMYHVDKEGHAVGPQTIACSLCDARFLSYAPKLYHEKTAHGLDVDLDNIHATSPSQKPTEIIKSPVKMEPQLNCRICKKSFTSLDHLKFHEANDHPLHDEKLNVTDGVHAVKLTIDKKGAGYQRPEEFSCMICSITFVSYSERWLHEEEFEKSGSYRCMDCGLDYKTKHQKKAHECNTRASAPASEASDVTSSGRPLIGFKQRKCHACNKFFTDKESFKYHVRKHWYRCFSCHYDFCSKKSMKAHLKLQKCFHPKTQGFERMFDEVFVECLLCDEVLSISDHINLHFLDHTIKENGKYDMFICLMCGAPYKIIEQLQEHMQTEGYFMVCREAPHLKDLDLGNNEDAADPPKDTPDTSQQNSVLHQWGCPFCSCTYQNYKSAWSHIRSYHKSIGVPFKIENGENADSSISSGEHQKTTKDHCNSAPIALLAQPSGSMVACPTATKPHCNTSSATEINKARLLLSELLTKSQEIENNRNKALQQSQHAARQKSPASSSLTDVTPASDLKNATTNRSRNTSESSVSSAGLKKNPNVTSPEAAAKTAGLIAQFLRGPGTSPLLPTPKSGPLPTATSMKTQPLPTATSMKTQPRPPFTSNHPTRPHTAPRGPGPGQSQYRDFFNSRPHLNHNSRSYPAPPHKQNPPYRPHQNENMRGNFGGRYNNQQYQQGSRINNQRMPQRIFNPRPSQNTNYFNGYTSNKRMRFDHPVQHTPPHYRNNQQSGSTIEHSTAENISWQSELSSRSQSPGGKSCVHKCEYCQRIFKNYINVYNHLARNHTDEIPNYNGSQIKPISTFDGRMTIWSLITS